MLRINKSYKDFACLLFPEYAEKFLLMTDTPEKVRIQIDKDVPDRTSFLGNKAEFERYIHAWKTTTDDSYTQGNADARVYKALYEELYLRKKVITKNGISQQIFEPFNCCELGFSYIDDNQTVSAFSLVFDPERRNNWYLAVIKNPHQNVENREVFFLSGIRNERNQALIEKGYQSKQLPMDELLDVVNSKRLESLVKCCIHENKVKPSVVLLRSFTSYGGGNCEEQQALVNELGEEALNNSLLNTFYQRSPNAVVSTAILKQFLKLDGVINKFLNDGAPVAENKYDVLEKILLSEPLHAYLNCYSGEDLSSAVLSDLVSEQSELQKSLRFIDNECQAIEGELQKKLYKSQSVPLNSLTKGYKRATKLKLDCYQRHILEYKETVQASLFHYHASPCETKKTAYKRLCHQVRSAESNLLNNALTIERFHPVLRKTKQIVTNIFSHITLIGLAFNIYHYSKTNRWLLHGTNETETRACELGVELLSQASKAIKV